jgi:hypothetical protein
VKNGLKVLFFNNPARALHIPGSWEFGIWNWDFGIGKEPVFVKIFKGSLKLVLRVIKKLQMGRSIKEMIIMKTILIFLVAVLFSVVGCNNEGREETPADDSVSNGLAQDSILPPPAEEKPDSTSKKTYSNQRFRNVTVENLDGDSIRVTGKAQIFEASFGWVIEDGHNELKQGFSTADAGAPDWGNFDFTILAKKDRPNSTLHLILFETSMKDGKRVHELSIPLMR